MDTTFEGAASSQPAPLATHASEPVSKAQGKTSISKTTSRPTRKLIRIGNINLHPDFAEFTSAIAKISFELKSIWQAPDIDLIKRTSRREIEVVAKGESYLVVKGIRCWQLAATILDPKERVDVIVLPTFVESDIFQTLVDELIITQILFRSSRAGAEQTVSLYGEFRRDPRFRPILRRIFKEPPTKERFVEILGLRSETISRRRKKKMQVTSGEQKAPNQDMLKKDHGHEQ